MASRWHIKVSTVATAEEADDAQVRITEAVRSETEALCSDLADRANLVIAVERLASPSVDPVGPLGSNGSGNPSSQFTDWLVTVEVHDGPDAVVEMRLLDLCERLEHDIEDVALVELTRSVERRVQHVGRVDAGYRIVIGLPTDRPLSDLPTVRDFVSAAAEWLAGAIEIRGLGKVRVEWSALSVAGSTFASPDSSPTVELSARVAEIVGDRDAAAMEAENGQYRGMEHALCQHVACAPGTVPWTASVHRFVVEAPSPNDTFNFWNGYPEPGS